MSNKPQFFIGVACKEHVENGVKLGIAQFCHGKSARAKRLRQADYVIYYSPKITLDANAPYQKFTAIGVAIDDEAYEVDMGNGFIPYRRNINYFKTTHLDIKPLIDRLPFIKNKAFWGVVFRYGFIKIDQESFDIIALGMMGQVPRQSSSN